MRVPATQHGPVRHACNHRRPAVNLWPLLPLIRPSKMATGERSTGAESLHTPHIPLVQTGGGDCFINTEFIGRGQRRWW